MNDYYLNALYPKLSAVVIKHYELHILQGWKGEWYQWAEYVQFSFMPSFQYNLELINTRQSCDQHYTIKCENIVLNVGHEARAWTVYNRHYLLVLYLLFICLVVGYLQLCKKKKGKATTNWRNIMFSWRVLPVGVLRTTLCTVHAQRCAIVKNCYVKHRISSHLFFLLGAEQIRLVKFRHPAELKIVLSLIWSHNKHMPVHMFMSSKVDSIGWIRSVQHRLVKIKFWFKWFM